MTPVCCGKGAERFGVSSVAGGKYFAERPVALGGMQQHTGGAPNGVLYHTYSTGVCGRVAGTQPSRRGGVCVRRTGQSPGNIIRARGRVVRLVCFILYV